MTLDTALLPTLNALLNATTSLLLARGWWLIRRGERERHRVAMLGACVGSALFLISYGYYHYRVGSVRFPGHGAARTFYLAVLASHTILAAAVPVMAVLTLSRALRARFAAHRAIARWTLPIWLYVSVTGVAVYWMLYRMAWS